MITQNVIEAATTVLPVQKAHGTSTKPRRAYRKHRLTKLLKADCRQIDGSLPLGIAMSAYRADLISSLGGKDNLSVQECTLVEACSRVRLVHLLRATHALPGPQRTPIILLD